MNTPRKSLKRSKYGRSVKKYDRRCRSVKKSNPRHKRYSGNAFTDWWDSIFACSGSTCRK